MVNENKSPVICDLGFASEAFTENFELRGTPPYMPVEYFNGLAYNDKNYDYKKADMWSLGVILY